MAIALNLWGDREVTWLDGRRMSERDFARLMRVQFTPSLLFIDGDSRIVARLNGYHPPHRIRAALDYVAGGMENRLPLGPLASLPADTARPSQNEQPFFMKRLRPEAPLGQPAARGDLREPVVPSPRRDARAGPAAYRSACAAADV